MTAKADADISIFKHPSNASSVRNLQALWTKSSVGSKVLQVPTKKIQYRRFGYLYSRKYEKLLGDKKGLLATKALP